MITTFYSFKGGTGRTMALANTAVFLAQRGKRVLAVDFDLEAPGLIQFFSETNPELGEHPGVIDFLTDRMHQRVSVSDWRAYTADAAVAGCTLQIMSSGRADGEYANRVLGFNWSRFFETYDGGQFIETLREEWDSEFDHVLIDSRTGITDTGGICTIAFPDLIVPVFTANRQSVDGVVDVLRRAQAGRQQLSYDRPPAAVLPLPSRVDTRTEHEASQEWLDVFVSRFSEFYGDWLPRDIEPREILERTKLPYVAYFSYGEKLPILSPDASDPESLGFALRNFASLIESELGNSTDIVTSGSSGSTAADFFVSYSIANEDWARWIAVELERAGYSTITQVLDFRAGADFVREMRQATVAAKRIIVVLSSSYIGSQIGDAEWRSAFARDASSRQGVIVTIRVESGALPASLKSRIFVDFVGVDEETARGRLLAGIEAPSRPISAPFPGGAKTPSRRRPRRVFLSHTSEVRSFPSPRSFVAAAETAISRSGDFAVDMAYFAARESAVAEIMREEVRSADVFVLIAGFRYGTVVRGQPDLSYTELEYLTAIDADIPCLIFLVAEDAQGPAQMFIDVENGARQQEFRSKLNDREVVAYVASPEALETALLHALSSLPATVG